MQDSWFYDPNFTIKNIYIPNVSLLVLQIVRPDGVVAVVDVIHYRLALYVGDLVVAHQIGRVVKGGQSGQHVLHRLVDQKHVVALNLVIEKTQMYTLKPID